jgi:hypothetical protein
MSIRPLYRANPSRAPVRAWGSEHQVRASEHLALALVRAVPAWHLRTAVVRSTASQSAERRVC